jgi:hypothetical protein
MSTAPDTPPSAQPNGPSNTPPSALTNTPRPNPYVGPRAFTYNERLWGRDREIAELVDLLIAERIVLLFSPSGAGKSSLLEAGLRKALEKEEFVVLPSMRVAPREAAARDGVRREGSALEGGTPQLSPSANPYTASALLCLEKAMPAGESLFDSSSPLDLAAALDRLNGHHVASPSPLPSPQTVLIFDQFEEVLTLNPADQARKEEFFTEIGRVLRDRNRWAIFAMREEYVAALDPYLRSMPTRLGTRYRLDLLGPSAALDAIREPAKLEGVDFTHQAAAIVIDDLRRIRVSKPGGGGTEDALGPHIEPVQLQVVCRRIWNALPPETRTIDLDTRHASAGTGTSANAETGGPAGGDVLTVRSLIGNAQRALTAYYDETIRGIVDGQRVNERQVRDWFERELMTTQGLRTQAAQDADETVAIRAAIPGLLGAHLIREETRRGGTWYELAHDRLVAPIRESNERFYREHASGVETQAAVWERNGRRPELLLQDDHAIDEAEQWGREHPDRVTERVNAFLNASRRAALERATRRTRVLAAIALGAALLIAIVAGVLLYATTKARALQEAETQLAKSQIAKMQADAERQKATEAAAALRKTVESAGALVQERYGEAAPPPPGSGGSPAPSKVTATESLQADIALKSLPQPQPTIFEPLREAAVMYYTRDRDNSKVVGELEKLGFAFTLQPSKRSSRASNCVWYGAKVTPDEVRVVALALLRAGVGLQAIKPFENSPDKDWIIEIGNRNMDYDDVLGVDDVQRLSRETPEIFPRKPTAAKAY